MEDVNSWNNSITLSENEKYHINGLNIWDYKWNNTGEYFDKKEPVRQINFKIPVYEIINEGIVARFGAMEVSNNAWVIYSNYK